MPARQVSNVSSSTPAAIRFLVDRDWFMELDSAAAAPDIAGLVDFGSAATIPDVAGLDTAAPPSAVDEPPEDSIVSTFRSLAQPPIMRPKNVIKIVFPSM